MRKTKITFILLTVMLIFAVLPSGVLALSGAGNESAPYIISSAADLAFVRDNPGAYYKLAANITLNSEWIPIGTYEKPFSGVFDGDSFDISGVTLSQSGTDVYAGLFGYSTGVIKNLNVIMSTTGISVNSSKNAYIGGIVAYNNGGQVTNCSVNGTITVTVSTAANASNVYVGMIAGRSTGPVSGNTSGGSINARVTETSSTGTAANEAQIYAGGIVGLSSSDLDENISETTIQATSSASSKYVSPKVYAGGIAGENTGSVIKSRASGNITASATSAALEAAVYAGGLVGKNNGDISIAKATGSVVAKTNAISAKTYAGGLVGYITGNITNTYATGNATAEATTAKDTVYAGGLVGLGSGQITKSYAVGTASVTATSTNALQGGLVGFSSVAATDSYYKENAAYTTFTGCGTAKTDEDLRTQTTFANWDFENTWKILESKNNGYPILIEFSNIQAVFEDVEYTYDGTEKILEATDIADGVTVTYANNKATNAGVYNAVATLSADGYNITQLNAKLTIKPRLVTITGLKVKDKEFDNTSSATIDASDAVIDGIVEGDIVTIDAENSVANFVTDNIGENIQVIISEVKFTGEDAANYTAGIYYAEADIFAGTYDDVVLEGSGTATDPYLIYDEDELNAIRGKLDAHFKLVNNITLANEWIPIGSPSKAFAGTLDGNDCTISGLTVDPDINYTYSGLFGYSTGYIHNLNIEIDGNICTTASNAYVGVIAGGNAGKISNCSVTGAITTNPLSTYMYVGGITGLNDGTINHCNSHVEIAAEGSTIYAGGVAGENNNIIETTIATQNVSATGSLFVYAGGFVGINNSSINNSYALGNVTVINTDVAFMVAVGGFAGRVEGGNISNCYSTGVPSVSGEQGTYILNEEIGGFTSYNKGTLTECYYDKQTSGKSDSDKGNPKTTAEMTTLSTFANWDAQVWTIDENVNDGYPYIKEIYEVLEKAVLGYNNRTVSVTAYSNIQSATLLVATYRGGALIDLAVENNFSAARGETEYYTVPDDFEDEGGTVKVMLWRNLDSANPLCAYKEVIIR